MGGTHMAHGKLKSPGKFELPSGTRGVLILMVVGGISTTLMGFKVDPTRQWAAFVQNHFYFMSLALGGLFFAAIQWITGSMWSATTRRLAESFASYLPVALGTLVILNFGMHDLYSWTHAGHVQGDVVLEGKSGYLNTTFFMIRNLVAIAIWIAFSKIMVSNSLAQDTDPKYKYTARNKAMSPVFLIIFGVTFTMASFDQIMSLDPHWFSTMFGVYCFAGLFYSVLAALCLLTLYLKAKGHLEGIVNDNHLHDIGKFMFAFTVFWAYISFSQFMLIWYANLPEETGYYLKRFHGGWMYVSLFLLIGKFLVPFLVLLPRDAKRNTTLLGLMACFMLVAQWVDVLWMIQPEFFQMGPKIGWIEIGSTLGFLGTFCLFVTAFLAKNNIVAIGDPRLSESVHHHHQ